MEAKSDLPPDVSMPKPPIQMQDLIVRTDSPAKSIKPLEGSQPNSPRLLKGLTSTYSPSHYQKKEKPQEPTIHQEFYNQNIQKVVDIKDELHGKLDNFDGIINEVVERSNNMLNWSYKPKIDDAKKQIQDLKNKIREIEKKKRGHHAIAGLTKKLSEYKDMTDSLRKRFKKLENEVEDEKCKRKILYDNICDKKVDLDELNKQNMQLWQKLEQLKQHLVESKRTKNAEEIKQKFFITGTDESAFIKGKGLKTTIKRKNLIGKSATTVVRSPRNNEVSSMYSRQALQYPSINYSLLTSEQKEQIGDLKEELTGLTKLIQNEQTTLNQVRGYSYSKLRDVIDLSAFYKECFKVGEKLFFKEQEVQGVKEKGMAGSLVFELKRKNMKDKIDKPNTYSMQDRHTKNVIYKAIRSIIQNARDQKKMEHMLSIKLDWNDFVKFKALHVIGLLLLRSDVQEQLMQDWFPSPFIFQSKEKVKDVNQITGSALSQPIKQL